MIYAIYDVYFKWSIVKFQVKKVKFILKFKCNIGKWFVKLEVENITACKRFIHFFREMYLILENIVCVRKHSVHLLLKKNSTSIQWLHPYISYKSDADYVRHIDMHIQQYEYFVLLDYRSQLCHLVFALTVALSIFHGI